MKKECRRIEELLERFLDGELDEAQSASVAEHLGECAECQHKLAELQAIDRLFREKDEPPKLAEEYWDWHRSQVWRRMRADRRREYEGVRRLRFNWIRGATVAAGAAVVLIAAIGGWRLLQRPKAAPMAVAEEQGPEHGFGAEPAAATRTGGRQAEPRDRAEVPKAVTAPRASGGARQPAAGLAMATDEVEAEGLADADGGLTTETRESTLSEIAEATGGAADRGQELSGESVTLAAKQAPAARTTAEVSVAGEKEGWLAGGRAEYATACDSAPEVVDIGILPRVPPDETATVFIRALVEPDGSVSSVELESASGSPLLDTIAFQNVQQARFRAGYFQGEPVRCWVRIAQQFEAEIPAAAEPEEDNQ